VFNLLTFITLENSSLNLTRPLVFKETTMSSIRTRNAPNDKTSHIMGILIVTCVWLFIYDIVETGVSTENRPGAIVVLILLAAGIIAIFQNLATSARRVTVTTLAIMLFALEIALGWLASLYGVSSPYAFLAFAAQIMTLLVILRTAKKLN